MKGRALMKKLYSRLKNEKGSTLLFVVILLSLFIVLGAAIATTAIASSATAALQIQSQQAYFTARSAANATAQKILSDSNFLSTLTYDVPLTGSATDATLGKYDLKIEYTDNTMTKIRLTSTGTYQNEKSQVVGYLNKSGQSSTVITPLKNLIYVNGNEINPSQNTGDVVINGDLTISSGTSITGNVIVTGDATLSGDAKNITRLTVLGNVYISSGSRVDGDIYTNGTLTIDGGNNIYGNIYAKGNVSIKSGGYVHGNVYTKGNFNIDGSGTVDGNVYAMTDSYIKGGTINGSIYEGGSLTVDGGLQIKQNAVANGSITFTNGNVLGNALCGGNAALTWSGKVSGSLTAGGNITYPQDPVSNFVGGAVNKNAPYTPINMSTYLSWSDISFSPAVFNTVAIPSISNSVNIVSNVISSDGVLNFNPNNLSWGTAITLDATQGDIRLLVNQSFSMSNGLRFIEKIDPANLHHVYIYLNNNASFTMPANAYIGCVDKNNNSCDDKSTVYIIGNGSSTLSMTNNSTFCGHVFLPMGSLSASGSPYTGIYKIIGSAVLKTASITSNLNLKYVPPDSAGTILDNTGTASVSGGGYGAGATPTWSFSGWAAQ